MKKLDNFSNCLSVLKNADFKLAVKDIVTFAKRYSVRKVILFGSRARGNNTERSDIDIAVYGGD